MSGLPAELPWRRFICVLRKLGYRPDKAGRGTTRSFVNRARNPSRISFREPHPHQTLRTTLLHQYMHKLRLTPDEFLLLLKDC